MKKHSTHPEILRRLRRAEGHLKSIVTMIEAERECLDVAQQLQAVEKALANAKRQLIHDHMNHCLNEESEAKTSLKELRELAKYL